MPPPLFSRLANAKIARAHRYIDAQLLKNRAKLSTPKVAPYARDSVDLTVSGPAGRVHMREDWRLVNRDTLSSHDFRARSVQVALAPSDPYPNYYEAALFDETEHSNPHPASTAARLPWAAWLGKKIDFCFGSQGISLLEQSETFHERNSPGSLKWYEILYKFPADHIYHHGVQASLEIAIYLFVFLPPIALGAAGSAALTFGRGSQKDLRLAAVFATTCSATWRMRCGLQGWPPTVALAAALGANAYFGLPRIHADYDPRESSIVTAAMTANMVYGWCMTPAQCAASAPYFVGSSMGLILKAVVLGISVGCEKTQKILAR